MGNPLFGIDISGIIADNIGPGVLPVVLSKPNKEAERDPDNLTAGFEPTDPTEYTARGFWEDFTGTPPPGVEVLLNDRKAIILGDTISPAGAVPERGWSVTIEGATLWIVKCINRDPAAAVYTYQCRDRAGPDGD